MIFAMTQYPDGDLIIFMDETGETPKVWGSVTEAVDELKNNTLANAMGVLFFDTNNPCNRF